MTPRFPLACRKAPRIVLAAGLLALLGATASASEPLQTCFLYSNPIGESGWTYQHELARKELAAAMGNRITTKYVENIAEGPDAERVIRNFVQEGCKLIFTPSFGFMEPTLKVARQAPKVIFMNGTGYKTAANVGVYNARYYEGRYLEGVIAGSMSKSGVVGYVGAFPIPEVLQGVNAFAQGMRSVNPKAQLRLIWVNAWYDPGRERDAANALVKLGVDTLAYATSGVSIVTTGEEKGIYTLGYYSDMSRFGPKTNLTSVVQNWGGYYIKVVEDVLAGRWKSDNVMGGLREGMIKMAPLNPSLPAEVREKVGRLEKDIAEGRLHPFAGPVLDQEGKLRVAAGQIISAADLASMNYLVQGVEGLLPKP
ncbi:Purine-binding protein precursor [Variovorax sp. PBS-H4]|uniref:BMP family ABC transporter substrate-binding protein n=1 Tax=Variovorax sp. PBS-H4 TaxID=434008 RepID=UPI0013169968|nr:BMP family ABC transporter substrate-binding protein [Variovorax sp. PBS-H4]VTU23295.1 Purine-binding protein precursor [Variovorax sp. PBS-H4]